MSHLDRFLNSEFPFVREVTRGAIEDFEAAIVIPNEHLPEYLQTHDKWEKDDRPGMGYDPSKGQDGRLYGTDLATIRRRMDARKKVTEESAHQVEKREKASRIDRYAEQIADCPVYNDKRPSGEVKNSSETPPAELQFDEDEFRIARKQLRFLNQVLSHDEWEEFEEEVQNSLT